MKPKRILSLLLCSTICLTASPIRVSAESAGSQDEEAKVLALFQAEAKKHTAENPDLTYRLWTTYHHEDWGFECYYLSLTSCKKEEGTPDAAMIENVDYCDYDSKSKTYYRIFKPYEMTINKDYNGSLSPVRCNSDDPDAEPEYFQPSDRFVVGDRMYVRDFDKDDQILLTTTYVPVGMQLNLKNPLSGEDVFTEYFYVNEEMVDDGKGNYIGHGTYTVSTSNFTFAALKGDGMELRKVNGRLWKPEAGDIKLTMMPPEDYTLSATYKTDKDEKILKESTVLSSEGDLSLIFTLLQEKDAYKKDLMNSWFSALRFGPSTQFTPDENAPDAFVFWYLDNNIRSWYQQDDEHPLSNNAQIPRELYVAAADKYFVHHSDLKDYLMKQSNYDSKTDCVIYQSGGGVGDPDNYRVFSWRQEGSVYHVYGAYCSLAYGKPTDDMIENADYINYSEEYNQYWSIGGPLECDMIETEDGFQLASFQSVDYYILDDVLYEQVHDNPDSKYEFRTEIYPMVEMTAWDAYTGKQLEATCTFDSKTGSAELKTADGSVTVNVSGGIVKEKEGRLWYTPDSKLSFKVTPGGIFTKAEVFCSYGETNEMLSAEGSVSPKNSPLEICACMDREKPQGDTDGDGQVSVDDAQLALLAYVNAMTGLESSLTEQQVTVADINGDKTVSVEDAQAILLYYVSNTLSGQNVTWDELLGKKASA